MATICVNTFLTGNAENIAYADTKFVSADEYIAVGGYNGKAIVTKFRKNCRSHLLQLIEPYLMG